MTDAFAKTPAEIDARLRAIADDANMRLTCAGEGGLRFQIANTVAETLAIVDRTMDDNDPEAEIARIPASLVALAAPVHFGSLVLLVNATRRRAYGIGKADGRRETQDAMKKALGL